MVGRSGSVPNSLRLVTTNSTRGSEYITLGGKAVDAPDAPNPGTRQIYLSEVHIKPIDPWTPDYVEDTSFLACVPVADPFLEPPLHVYKDANNQYGWCTKAYPTQNPNWDELNKAKHPAGIASAQLYVNYLADAKVSWFTSHQVGGSSTALDGHNGGGQCSGTNVTNRTNICGLNPDANQAECIAYLAFLSKGTTCDRTVVPGAPYKTFPLQASDDDISDMLKNDLLHDKNFGCNYSVNADPSKVGKKVPSTGCCGVYNGTAVLDSIINGVAPISGHLEPFVNPAVPNIRFCGSPVE